MRKLILSTLSTLALLIYPLYLSAQNSFSLSLDVDGSAGDQAVTSLNVSADQIVTIQIFGKDIQNANGLAVRFEYDAGQVVYEGFDAGDVLPNAQALPEQGTNPTFVEIGIASLGGQATVNSGLVGTVRFRATAAFSGTEIRLVRAELGRGGRFETIMPNIRIALQGAPTPANFSLSLDVDGSTGDQAVTSVAVSTEEMVAIQIFGQDIRNANGISIRFEYDASQVTYDGFDVGDTLPNAQALPEQGTNPTFVQISLVSFGGQTTSNSGLLGTIRFRTTDAFSGTAIRLVRAELGRGGQIESATIDVRVELKLQVLTPDFNRDGMVNFADFLAFAGQFGARQGDGRYDAKYDLDSDGTIGFGDFLIFGKDFGKDVSTPGGSGGSTGIVDIPDANLRAVIADSLGKARGAPITRAEMATLTRLDAPNKGIRSLTGLEHATNLQTLELGSVRVNNEWVNSNDISNLSPLSNLTNLTWLDLTSNSISSISALSRLNNLKTLRLSGNNISDISILAGLTELTGQLGLGNNNISDISALANLTNLTSLWISGNNISDISALANLTNLTSLYLDNNNISDISALANLTNLTFQLGLSNNNISDISALSGLSRLEYLFLSDNNISDLSPLAANMGLGEGDFVAVRNNPLSATSLNTHIPALQRRGATVVFDSSSGSGGSSSPDLIVESPSVSDNTLTTGQSFTLSATVRNQGTGSSAATTLRYYRSSNATISTSDTEVGTDSVSGLSASGTSAESISLNAPSSAGTYYYGACVNSVTGESDTNNNCSDGVSVTVSSSSGGGGSGGSHGACRAGLVVNPNESCTYKGHTFSVSSSGTGSISFFSAGSGLNLTGNINGVQWNFVASKNSDSNSWTIHTAD